MIFYFNSFHIYIDENNKENIKNIYNLLLLIKKKIIFPYIIIIISEETGEYVRKVGGEYGATTGRPRRCGWLDLNVIRYAHMLNDFSSINITKLDVLDGMKEIKIGYKYQIDGKEIDYMPSTIEELNKVSVVYETLPG